MEDATWHVRPYEEGDEVGLTKLWTQVFGRPMTPEYWRWKLKGRPTPVQNVWVAAASDGRIVGQYAGIPADLKLSGNRVRGFVIVDLMTHPDFRRRGVLAMLRRRAEAAWAGAGVAVVLGLPNEGGQASLTGWARAFRLRRSRMVVRVEEVLGRAGRIPQPLRTAAGAICRHTVDARRRRSWPREDSAVVVQAAEGNAHAFAARGTLDALWESVSPNFDNTQVRSAEWWQWRFLNRPASPYRLLTAHVGERVTGAAAYRFDATVNARRGTLCELFVAPEDEPSALALTRVALEDLWQQGAGTVSALAPEDGTLERRLSATGFRPQPQAFDLMYMPLRDPEQQPFSNDSSAWHLSGADFDVV